VETAKTLSYAWKKPLIMTNHIAGHIYANFIDEKKKIQFPAIALTVSGGHTNLVLIGKHLSYKIIGETRDDAGGEAFDKGAKMMDIGYPGGPAVNRYAKIFAESKKLKTIKLPRPMIFSPDLDFSFSGLKTALLYQLQKDSNWKKKIPEYCHELQEAIIETLVSKTIKAAKKYHAKTVLLSGGVSANPTLRATLEEKVKTELPQTIFSLPQLPYTTDNAAMIAMLGYYLFKSKKYTPWQKAKANCNLTLK
jgi:N6-L-threonylcarbamoyladenine synthase